MAKKVLLRADGSHVLGMGHVMRCLALAKQQEPALTVRIVEGPNFSAEHKAQSRKALADALLRSVQFVDGSAIDIAREFLQCDRAVISDSLTKYEAALTGTPAIAISQDDHQKSLSRAFMQIGCCVQYGPGGLDEPQRLADLISSVCADVELRQRMSSIGK